MLTQNTPLTPTLARAEFAHLCFECRLSEAVEIDAATILRLRRRLRTVALETLRPRDDLARSLFDPPLSADPVALKRYQKGAPAFVIVPPAMSGKEYEAGDLFHIQVRLFGNISALASALIEVFVALGRVGLRLDAGRYTLEQVKAFDAGGISSGVWYKTEKAQVHNIPRLDLGWWLEGQPQACRSLELKFITPARLLTRGRPMFDPGMEQMFPFVLRRVTAMLYIHCGVELDPADIEFPRSADGWSETENKLHWHDWRHLYSETGRSTPLGGICGSLRVEGDISGSALAVVQLGSLLNLGKNAAYGAGGYCISYMGGDAPL